MSSTCASVVDQLPPHRKHIHIPAAEWNTHFIFANLRIYILDAMIQPPPDSQTSIAA